MTPKEKLSYAALCLPLLGALWTGISYSVEFVNSVARKDEVDSKVDAVTAKMQSGFDAVRRHGLEDKIFELSLTPDQSQIQKALAARYTQELLDLNNKKGQ